MRLIFIPGFGEDPSIFDKIHPNLPADKVFADNWKLLGNKPRRDLDVLQYARELVERFSIGPEDVVVGHSMGGWVAWHIKHFTGSRIIQISSWTDPRKVVVPVHNRNLIYAAVKSGLVYNVLTKRLIVWKDYRNKPSRETFSAVMENLVSGDIDNVLNQLRIIFNPTEKITVKPDLRIHARADTIIRYPDHPTVEVPGDHFSLYTYPEVVYPPILRFLEMEA